MKLDYNNFSISNIIFVVCIISIQSVCCSKSWEHCSACKVIVDEIEAQVKTVDPKKVLEVEGFRVDPRGNQKKRQIPYARSETHLTDITDTLCQSLSSYGIETNKETGAKNYVKTDVAGGSINLENVSFSTEHVDRLKSLCNSLIEEHDDSFMEFFRKPHDNPKQEFCYNVTEICQDDEDDDDDGDEEEETEQKDEL